MTTRIPHLLEPYFAQPPEGSQTLLTSVLSASTNWLVLRYLYSYLHRSRSKRGLGDGVEVRDGGDAADVNVVLLSFMRDFAFWKEGAGRLGLDLESLARNNRFIYIDGLTELLLPSSKTPQSQSATARKGHRVLRSPELRYVRRELLAAISDLASNNEADGTGPDSRPKTILIVDQPDFLLAASADLPPSSSTAGQAAGAGSNELALRNLLLDVREQVHASIVSVAADDPLVTAGTGSNGTGSNGTGLEREHAAFVLSLAHGSDVVLGLRSLDTGSASDVSGVVRITRGGDSSEGHGHEEGEFLYFVGGDGSVKVFHRGQGG